MPDLSRICDLHHSSGQCPVLNPMIEARDRTHNLMVPSRIRFYCATTETPHHFLKTNSKSSRQGMELRYVVCGIHTHTCRASCDVGWGQVWQKKVAFLGKSEDEGEFRGDNYPQTGPLTPLCPEDSGSCLSWPLYSCGPSSFLAPSLHKLLAALPLSALETHRGSRPV